MWRGLYSRLLEYQSIEAESNFLCTSQLDKLYEELPILVIDDWTEITEEFLNRKYEEITSQQYNIEQLYMNYWKEKILSTRDAFMKEHHEE